MRNGMIFIALSTLVAVPVISTLQGRLPESRLVSCLPGLPTAVLNDVITDSSSLPNIFHHLLPNILVERVSGSQGNVQVREFIKRELGQLGWTVEEDTFVDQTPHGQVTFSNIIATLRPGAAKRLVVACHYDSKYLPGHPPFLGASDSAVPCSVMLDTARQLTDLTRAGRYSMTQDVTPQLIFCDGEEAFVRWTANDSLYGSRHLANLWENTPDRNDPNSNNLANIDFFVLLDLIGPADTRFVDYYRNTSHLFNQLVGIEQCLSSSRLLRRHFRSAIFNPYGRAQLVEDDHTPFIHRGVPVLHLISTPFPRVWHTHYDNAYSLDTALIADFTRIFQIFIASRLYGV